MLLISTGRLAQFALLLLTLRLATGFLSPSEMGKISIVTATVAFFALLLLNPVGMFMNRRLHAWDKKGLVSTYLLHFWRYLLVVSICAAFILVGLVWLNIWIPSVETSWLLFLVCGNLIFATVNQVVVSGLNMFGHRGLFMAMTVATAALSLAFAVLLVHTVSPAAEYWLSGLLIGQMIVGLIGKKIFFKKLHHTKDTSGNPLKLTPSHLNALAMFAWPVAIAVGLGWIQSQGYRYLMEGQLGLAELGLFVAGFGISSGLIAGFESIYSTFFQPKFYKRISNDNLNEQSQAWIDYAQSILPALLLTAMFIVATASELSSLLLGQSFKDSTQFIIWGAMAELFRVATSVFGMAAHARMNTRMLLLPNLIGAVTAVLLITILTPRYGSAGVGMGLVFSSIISLTITALITQKYLAVALSLQHFMKSIIMGLGILIFSVILKQIVDSDESLLFAFVRLCIIGIFFILFQYLLILPILREDISSQV